MFLKKFLSVVALGVFVFQTQLFAAIIRVPYDASTIYAAALQANAYDVIEVYNGTHYITQTVYLEDDHLTLRAAPGNYPVIVVNVTHPVSSYGLLIARGAKDPVDGVTVSGLYFQVTRGLAVWISSWSKNTTIEDCSFNIGNSNAGAAITAIQPQYSPTDELTIEGCDVWGYSGSPYAIYLKWTGSTYFTNNSIYNRNVYIKPLESDYCVTIYNNSMRYQYNGKSFYIETDVESQGTVYSYVFNNHFFRFNTGIYNHTFYHRSYVYSYYNNFYACSNKAHEGVLIIPSHNTYGSCNP